MREGWVEVDYLEAVDKVSASHKKIKQKEYQLEGLYPIIDQGQNLIGGYTDDANKLLNCNLPVLIFGDHTKIVKYVNFMFAPGADGTKVLEPKGFVIPKYLYYLTQVLVLKIKDKGYARHYQHLEKQKIEIAPLPEQQAIIAKIEQLFSELDNGIANLKAAKEKLETYRQAVLKKAFEGELTKEWRAEQAVSSKLPFVYLQNIADVATGATPNKANSAYWNKGIIPWVTSGALNNLYVSKASDFITEKGLKETNCKIFPRETLLIAMYGEGKTRGKCSELNLDAATNQAIAAILIRNQFKQSKKYLKWFFVKNYNDIRMLSSGGVQPNLNLTKIKETRIPFPDPQEQAQIVQEIETRLSLCDNILANIGEGLIKAEALRQSILKKAFAGQLLSELELEACRREPDWEPAEKLLERIKKSKKEDA